MHPATSIRTLAQPAVKPFLRLLGSALGLAFAVHSTAGIVIDNFSEGALVLAPTNYSPGLVQVQTGLPLNATIGGARAVRAQSQNEAHLEIEPVKGLFSFEVAGSHGYFTLSYGSEGALGVDLLADGSDAFLLTFADIYPRTVWRGLYYFSVNGDRYGLRIDSLAMNGSRMIRIPFSVFSSAPSFVVNTIQFEAARVPAGYRLVLDSIVTVNADAPPRLGFSLPAPTKLQIDWSTNVTGYIVETSPNLELDGWTPVTNRVDVVRGMFSVTVETPGVLGYFRLRHE